MVETHKRVELRYKGKFFPFRNSQFLMILKVLLCSQDEDGNEVSEEADPSYDGEQNPFTPKLEIGPNQDLLLADGSAVGRVVVWKSHSAKIWIYC